MGCEILSPQNHFCSKHQGWGIEEEKDKERRETEERERERVGKEGESVWRRVGRNTMIKPSFPLGSWGRSMEEKVGSRWAPRCRGRTQAATLHENTLPGHSMDVLHPLGTC